VIRFPPSLKSTRDVDENEEGSCPVNLLELNHIVPIIGFSSIRNPGKAPVNSFAPSDTLSRVDNRDQDSGIDPISDSPETLNAFNVDKSATSNGKVPTILFPKAAVLPVERKQ
jgi:hypothetical protein